MAKQNSSQGLFVSVGQREVFSFSWNSPAETLGSHVMLLPVVKAYMKEERITPTCNVEQWKAEMRD